MSGAYPASPTFQTVNFRSRWYNVSSETVTGRTQGRHLGGHRFEFSAKYPTLTRADHAAVDIFLEQQKGSSQTFTIVLPVISSASGSPAGSVTVSGAHAIGVSAIAVGGGFTGTLTSGDKVKFANHTKVYTITADLDGDTSSPLGSGTLNIMPPLIAALVNGEAITYDSVPFTVRQSGDVQEFEISPGVFYSREIDFVEAV